MSLKNSKAKGNRAEKDFAQYLRDCGLDTTASRNYSSGNNTQKSDVHNSLDYNFEVKHVEKLNILKAIEQVERYSEKNHSTPAVVFKKSYMKDFWIAIPVYEWVELIKKAKEPKSQFNANRELRWHLERMKQDCHKVIKLLEG